MIREEIDVHVRSI